MRVYEFSKKTGIPNKELLRVLGEGGFSIANHMAALTDEAAAYLEKRFTADKKTVQPKAPADAVRITEPVVVPEKKTAPQPMTKESSMQHHRDKNSSQKNSAARPGSSATRNYTQDNRAGGMAALRANAPAQKPLPSELICEPMLVSDFADKLGKSVSEIILALLKRGVVAAKNQVIDEKIVAQLLQSFGVKPLEAKKETAKELSLSHAGTAGAGDLRDRSPIVVVIGHVDHGKTSLLDFIRKTRVAAREKGGITQHIGAYEAATQQGNIIFLDTPGHEAFSMMRVRGIRVADIAILVVAADDGVMPQTVEAINAAKSVGLPIVVAINKIDKASQQQVEGVKKILASYDLVPEDWGGQTVMVPISAKVGSGITELLEMIVLQAQLMDLKASHSEKPRGFVLESKLEKGLGPVATIICHHGILKVGDNFVSGTTFGRVTALVDSFGKRIVQAQPATPVVVAGFHELPQAGDAFEVVTSGEVKKARVQQDILHSESRLVRHARLPQGEQILNVLIKADGVSTKEALINSIAKFSGKTFKRASVIQASVGDVTESDVRFAYDTQSIIYTLHVKAEPNALALANKLGVTIKTFDIIYKLLEDLQEVAEQGRPVKMVSKKVGEAVVLKVFPIKNIGVIAGSMIKSGRFVKDGKVVGWRGKQKIGEGKISSLQRDKKTVKEVHTGFECGFLVSGITDWQPDDRVECFIEVVEEQ